MESFISGTLPHALMDQDQNAPKTTAHRRSQFIATTAATVLVVYILTQYRAGGYGIYSENRECFAVKRGNKCQ